MLPGPKQTGTRGNAGVPTSSVIGFDSVWLAAGEARSHRVPITADRLLYADRRGVLVSHAGKWIFWVGTAADAERGVQVEVAF